MDAITTVEARATNTANNSFKVGNLDKGEVRTDLQKQWIARPHDQRFLSLTDLHTSVKARADRTTEIRIDTSKIEFVAPNRRPKKTFRACRLAFQLAKPSPRRIGRSVNSPRWLRPRRATFASFRRRLLPTR